MFYRQIATRIASTSLRNREYKWSLSYVEMYQSCRMKYKSQSLLSLCSFDVSLRKHFGRSLRELPPQLTHRLSFSTFSRKSYVRCFVPKHFVRTFHVLTVPASRSLPRKGEVIGGENLRPAKSRCSPPKNYTF